MSVQPNLEFEGSTYVAFSDLSGFKKMLEDADKAYDALDNLYNIAYDLFGSNEGRSIVGVACSDCVVSWIKQSRDEQNRDALPELLTFLKLFHERMLEKDYLLTSTIAWGLFKYERRIRLENFEKQLFYGKQYVKAYLANSLVDTGAIVLLKDGCEVNPNEHTEIRTFLQKYKEPAGWEYFWSASNPRDIKRVKKERLKAKDLRFERLKEVYRGGPHRGSYLAGERD